MRFAAVAILGILALPPPAMAAEAEQNSTILHLDQTAERTVPRDRMSVDLRAEATGADPAAVQAAVNRLMAAALAKVKTVTAVKGSSGNYQTVNVTPTGPNGKPLPPRWRAIQDLNLASRDFTAALDLAGQLQAGGLVIDDMRFDVAPETLRAAQRALTDEALKALTARAGEIAAALGLRVARIQNLHVGNASQPGGGPHPLLMSRVAGAAAPPPVVAAGDSTIAVAVNADIELAPAK